MTREHNGPKNLPLRRTMIKSTVGHVRRPPYDLPDAKNPSHTYGFEVARDPEGVGEVISRWEQATPSPAEKCGRSYVEINRQAIANGCISASEARQFAAEHPEIVTKIPDKKKVGYSPPKDVVYGIKSKASEDITQLIQARHTNFALENSEYPDLSCMKVKGKLPPPRDTRSSLGKDVRFHPPKRNDQDPNDMFKLTKFKKVPSILTTQPHHWRSAAVAGGVCEEDTREKQQLTAEEQHQHQQT